MQKIPAKLEGTLLVLVQVKNKRIEQILDIDNSNRFNFSAA